MIPLIKPYFDESEINAIHEVLQSGWVTQGPKCEEFESMVAKYLGCNHVISVTNCTAALYLALKAYGIGPGDSVIVPDYTFPATALAVIHAGARPIFVDVLPDTYNMNPDHVEDAIVDSTRAIIPVHLFGQSALMHPIIAIAEAYDLIVIEDVACALGASTSLGKLGTLGHIGCFSLHARKGITTGEGGLVCTDDKDIADKIKRMSNFGVERTYGRKSAPSFDMPGFNFKMSDIAAAIGIVQFSRIDSWIKCRRKSAAKMDKYILETFGGKLIPPENHYPEGHSYQSYVCVADPKERDSILDHFSKMNVETGIGTYACHMHPLFANSNKYPVSNHLYRNSISLPLWL